MYTNAFAYPAGGASGYKGGKFALVGPGWKGTLPAGVTRIDAPTRWIELQPRVNVKSEADLPAARKVLKAITLQGLSEYTGGAAPARPAYHYEVPKMTPGVATSHMQFDDPLQFWSIFSAALNENPPPASEIDAVLPSFKYLGIELGKQWKPDDVPAGHPGPDEEPPRRASATLRSAPCRSPARLRTAGSFRPTTRAMPGPTICPGSCVAVFGLTANATDQAIYYSGVLDGNNKPMTGAKRYTLTLKPPMGYARPVAPGFWSVTMYDRVTNYTAPNPINRYHLADYNDLRKNADGSITIYMQRAAPAPTRKRTGCRRPRGRSI